MLDTKSVKALRWVIYAFLIVFTASIMIFLWRSQHFVMQSDEQRLSVTQIGQKVVYNPTGFEVEYLENAFSNWAPNAEFDKTQEPVFWTYGYVELPLSDKNKAVVDFSSNPVGVAVPAGNILPKGYENLKDKPVAYRDGFNLYEFKTVFFHPKQSFNFGTVPAKTTNMNHFNLDSINTLRGFPKDVQVDLSACFTSQTGYVLCNTTARDIKVIANSDKTTAIGYLTSSKDFHSGMFYYVIKSDVYAWTSEPLNSYHKQ